MTTSRPTNAPQTTPMSAHNDQLEIPYIAPAAPLFKTNAPSPFSGNEGQNIREWVDKIRSFMDIQSVPQANDKRVQIVKYFLHGPAYTFFNDTPLLERDTFDKTITLLINKYDNENMKWLKEQTLAQLTQSGSVQNYINTFNQLASSLDKPVESRLFSFINGLTQEIKHHVLSHRPQTMQDAEHQALLKESLISTTTVPKPEVNVLATDIVMKELAEIKRDMAGFQKQLSENGRTHTAYAQTPSQRQYSCQYCSRNNHPSHLCYYKPANTQQYAQQQYRPRFPSNRPPRFQQTNQQQRNQTPQFQQRYHRPQGYRQTQTRTQFRPSGDDFYTQMTNAYVAGQKANNNHSQYNHTDDQANLNH